MIETLQKRGCIDAVTSDELTVAMRKPIKAYIGFDPTADSLHLGNLVGIITAHRLKKEGHTPVILLGGATAKVGDPSGKSVERPLLEHTTIAANVLAIKEQFAQCFGDAPLIMNNEDWLGKLTLIDFLREVGKHFRLGSMLGKESVRARVQSEEGMSFTEFSYQLFQGYDFYYLFQEHGVIAQFGGSDQWGNITAGIELTRKLTGKQVFGFTFPLLTRSDGKKFGKSEGGAIWLDPKKTSPYEFYQYLYRIPDADVITMMKMLTFMELEEIADYERTIATDPNRAQKRLAEEVTRYVHGEEGLALAARVTAGAAPGGETELTGSALTALAQEMGSATLSRVDVIGKSFADVATCAGLTSSKGEANRLIKNGGAYLNNEKVMETTFIFSESHLIDGAFLLLGSGKKKKLVVKIQFSLA